MPPRPSKKGKNRDGEMLAPSSNTKVTKASPSTGKRTQMTTATDVLENDVEVPCAACTRVIKTTNKDFTRLLLHISIDHFSQYVPFACKTCDRHFGAWSLTDNVRWCCADGNAGKFIENADYRRQPFIDEAIRLVFALSKQAIKKGVDAEPPLRRTLARLQAAKNHQKYSNEIRDEPAYANVNEKDYVWTPSTRVFDVNLLMEAANAYHIPVGRSDAGPSCTKRPRLGAAQICHICTQAFDDTNMFLMHFMHTHDHLPPPAMCDACGVYIRTGDEWEAHFEAMMSRSKQDKQEHRQLERPTEIMTVETNPDGFRKCVNIFAKLLEMHIDMDSLEDAFGLYTEALEAVGKQK